MVRSVSMCVYFRNIVLVSGGHMWLEAMAQWILVLGSLERVVDLLDRKSVNFSDRSFMPRIEL